MTAIHTSGYSGPERRRRRVYVTKNHEYHCLDGICIAVRDIRTAAFLRKHPAVGKEASAGLRLNEGGIETISPAEQARPGEHVHFVAGVDDPRDVLTSPIERMERPGREVVAESERKL